MTVQWIAAVATAALATASVVSANSPAGTPLAAADAVPAGGLPYTQEEKNERIREATRGLLRRKDELDAERRQAEREEARQKARDAHNPPTPEELEARRLAKAERKAERRRRAQEKFRNMSPESKVDLMSADELNSIATKAMETDPDLSQPKNQFLRQLEWWNIGGFTGSGVPSDYQPYNGPYADSGYEWDYWAQAYRMLGGFIDCDWQQGEDEPAGDRRLKDRDLSGSGDNCIDNGCGRWMMWAAYVNPNYMGGGYDEYFCNSDDGCSALDCHSPDTEWILMGVYRQEFYQYLEQISKHLWAVDDYEYAIALGGLAYMTDCDCFYMNNYYAGILPGAGGTFTLSLFEDDACLYPLTDINPDDAGRRLLLEDEISGGRDLSGEGENCRRRLEQDEERRLDDGSGNYGDFDCDYYAGAMEYTLTEMNEVYDTYRYCTLCIDYPTYQDGYLIGDDGTDEDSIINQCWKFHSHDSFPCNGDCIAKGSMQGTIIEVGVGSVMFGSEWEGQTSVVNGDGTTRTSSSRLERIKANLFMTFSGILFVATFLAFAVARGSGRERRRSRARSSKSRSLLSKDEKRRARSSSKHRSSRSKSRSKRSGSEHRRSSSGKRESRASRKYDDF